MKYLIVGLGNDGHEYENTRHNVGFLVVDYLVLQKKASFTLQKLANISKVKHRGRSLHIIKPTTFMNLSGKAVRFYLEKFKIPTENLLIISDDIAMDFGKLRLRYKGSAGGHNGLKSIEETLGSQDYTRLKVGVGNDFSKGKQVQYVLSDFSDDEQSSVKELLPETEELIYKFCLGIK